MSKYIVAIGGTGARVVQAVIHLAAAGLLKTQDNSSEEEIRLLFIEPDKGNGNLSSTTQTIQIYQRFYNLLGSLNTQTRDWIATKVLPEEQPNIWSLFANSNQRRLKDFFNFSSSELQHKHLLDVLFTQTEQKEVLDTKGFKGRPAIGAAVLKKLIRDQAYQESWRNLCNQIRIDANAKVILCGSVFGGTGASGLPLIAQELKNLNSGLELDALLVLPYFKFPESENAESQIFVRSEELMLRTKAALEYYDIRAKDLFDKCYLLGTPEFTEVEFSDGGQNQKNPPHFLELYAALAVRDSLFGEQEVNNSNSVLLLSRKSPQRITWDDIPDNNQVRSKILTATIFALIWLIIINPNLKDAQNHNRQLPYISRFYTRTGISNFQEQEQEPIKTVTAWCEDYWNWLVELHIHGSGIDLVQINAFVNRGILNQEQNNFAGKILDLYGIKVNDILNKLSNYKSGASNDDSTVKLAKALYSLLSPHF
ncbi:MAG: hypothetical protein KA716_09530 [Gloeotrichia echinulata DEX184]|nr:hypothetical protein [Gloeotrichia echinulata DEX184]